MRIFEEYSIFRLRRVLSIVTGIFAINLYAHGSWREFSIPENIRLFLTGDAGIFILLCAAYLMNDLFDLRYDSVNRPGKVYIGRVISRRGAALLVGVMTAAGLFLAWRVNVDFFLIVILQLVLVIVYNLFSKQLSFIKPVLISFLVVSIYPLSIALAGGGNPSPRFDSLFVFPVWLFVTTLSFELFCDMRDAAGDSVAGRKGYVEKAGAVSVGRMARILAVCAALLSIIPFAAGMCGYLYLAGSIVSVLPSAAGALSGSGDLSRRLHLSMVGVTLASVADILVFA